MSNLLAATLEKEVARVTGMALKRALAALNAEVTALKRKLEAQERKLASVASASSRRAAAPAADEGPPLDPTTIRAIRKRLGLSQASLAKVVSVTPVAVYFWEAGRTRPRGRTRAALLELKGLGKRAAQQRLAAAIEESGRTGAPKASGKRGARKGTAAGSRRKASAGRRKKARRTTTRAKR